MSVYFRKFSKGCKVFKPEAKKIDHINATGNIGSGKTIKYRLYKIRGTVSKWMDIEANKDTDIEKTKIICRRL